MSCLQIFCLEIQIGITQLSRVGKPGKNEEQHTSNPDRDLKRVTKPAKSRHRLLATITISVFVDPL